MKKYVRQQWYPNQKGKQPYWRTPNQANKMLLTSAKFEDNSMAFQIYMTREQNQKQNYLMC